MDPEQKPLRCRPRPIPHNLKKDVMGAIKAQLNAGIIRPSKSEWASPLHIVHKPSGGIRLTVDYSSLNTVIQFDPYPMPATKTIFMELTKSRWFSKFDFLKAYHQYPTAKDSIKYTAFVCEFGLYKYTCMPMGICTAAAWFQRCIDHALEDFLVRGHLYVYLDDVILHTDTKEQHLTEALSLIKTFNDSGLTVSKEKCQIMQKAIGFLGHIVTQGKVQNDPKRAEGIKNIPIPKTIHGLQRALGIFNYQREFIDHFAELAGPLYNIMALKDAPVNCRKKNGAVKGKLVNIEWADQARSCFEKLKEATSGALELYMPDFSQPFDLTTDASEYGHGAFLSQTTKST